MNIGLEPKYFTVAVLSTPVARNGSDEDSRSIFSHPDRRISTVFMTRKLQLWSEVIANLAFHLDSRYNFERNFKPKILIALRHPRPRDQCSKSG